MIAIPARKKPKAMTAEDRQTLIGNGPPDLNVRVLGRVFEAVSANQAMPLSGVQNLLKPDIEVTDQVAETIRYLLTHTSLVSLGQAHIESIYRKTSAMSEMSPEDVARIQELLQRPGIKHMYNNHTHVRMGIDQMALVFHMFRLGASTAAIREVFTDVYPAIPFDKTRLLVRTFYDMGNKAIGWDWNTPASQRKELQRLAMA